MVFNNNLLLGAAGAADGYTIDQSIRFDSVRNSDLTRTLSGDGNLKTGTFSFWMKRSGLGALQEIFTTYSIRSSFFFQSNDTLSMQIYNGASYTTLTTTAVFRDPSAFAHYLFRWDTTQATDTDRLQFYYNGVLQTVTGTYPAQNSTTTFSDATYTHVISGDGPANTLYEIDGYLAEIHYVDGTALAATDFGETNADTGQWVPIEYTGSYGTNGFYITGADSADLGADDSGNGNDFTSSGLTAADQVTDSPTDNYATLNPLLKHSSVTLADGNLEASSGTNGWFGSIGTVGIQLGDKVYFEGKCLTNTRLYFGLSRINGSGGTINPQTSTTFETASDTDYMWRVTSANEVYYQGASQSVTVSAVSVNDIVGCSVDTDGTVKFYKNGTEIHSFSTTLVAGDTYMPVYSVNGATSTEKWEARFGSTGISHQPTGFSLLRTSDIPDPTIALPEKYFNTVLYEGNGGGQRVGGFQPITETYTVPNSVIFNKDDSAYLSATLAANASKIWTISFWVKRGKLGADQIILDGGPDATNYERLNFSGATNALDYQHTNGGVTKAAFRTNMVFRDTSRWYNIVLAKDATATDIKLYVDGVQITDFASSTTPVNEDGHFFDNQGTTIGKNNFGSTEYLDAYIAEFYAVVGQQLTASSFGQLDASTNRWIPKDASGLTFGTNGFYLDMETAPGTGSGAGTDSSGNGNNFTESGLAAADQVDDSPTENYATLNPLRKGTDVTLSDGNLVADCGSGSASTRAFSTVGMPNSGKWTFQIEAVSSTLAGTDSISSIGIISDPYTNNTDVTTGSKIGQTTNQENAGLDFYNGFTKKDNASQITAAQLRNAGDKGIVAYDASTKELWLGYAQSTDSSWTWVGGGDPEAGTSPTYTMSEDNQYFAISTDRSKTIVRFGSNGDGLAPPTGFDYLNTDNLPLSNGDLSAFVWIKNRDATDNHMLFDAVRGATKDLHSNSTAAEVTNANTLTRFLKNGFEVSNDAEVNTSAESYVAWQWLTDSLTTSSNEDGSITSTVLANTTSGVSIVKYAGSLSATGSATVGHGLGTAPLVVISKSLDSTAGDSGGWSVQHTSLAASNILRLNTTAATSSKAANGTLSSPTSTVFYTNYTEGLNVTSNDYIAYCFAEVDGFSKFGSYTGNGSTDGPFIFTGMTPEFVIIKRSNTTENWIMLDNARSEYNVTDDVQYPNLAQADNANSTTTRVDNVSNGFKVRGTNTNINASGSTYIYMAFASSPFKTATAR